VVLFPAAWVLDAFWVRHKTDLYRFLDLVRCRGPIKTNGLVLDIENYFDGKISTPCLNLFFWKKLVQIRRFRLNILSRKPEPTGCFQPHQPNSIGDFYPASIKQTIKSIAPVMRLFVPLQSAAHQPQYKVCGKHFSVFF
jgi:hypothetical protein